MELEKLISDIVERVLSELVSEKKKNQTGIPSSLEKRNYSPPGTGTKRLITARDVERASAAGVPIEIHEKHIISPLALDMARQKNVKIIIQNQSAMDQPGTQVKKIEKIAVASDHGGFELKEKLKEYLYATGYMYKDFGTYSKTPVDYPDFAAAAARSVLAGECDKGVVIDGAGIGSAISANKIKGILAAVCHDRFTARVAREHDNANILCLGSMVLSDREAKEVLRTFLTTDFAGGRHLRRIEKIRKLEENSP